MEFRRHTTGATGRCETLVLSETNGGAAYDFMQRKTVDVRFTDGRLLLGFEHRVKKKNRKKQYSQIEIDNHISNKSPGNGCYCRVDRDLFPTMGRA